MPEAVTIVETPRDAFQGLPKFIPTAEKVRYIQTLLDTGFTHIDLGSFVSPKAVPQMADSREVITAFAERKGLERIAIIVNEPGLRRATEAGNLEALGFPFSLSEEFELRNTHRTQEQSWPLVEKLSAEIERNDFSFILYLSMAFGNPDKELWDEDDLFQFIQRLAEMGIRHISLADTVAVAKPEQVGRIFKRARAEHPEVSFSAHFHGRPESWFACAQAALEAGCRRFDAAAGGLGGCPFAQDALVANIPSDLLAKKLEELGFQTGIETSKLPACVALARELQAAYGRAE